MKNARLIILIVISSVLSGNKVLADSPVFPICTNSAEQVYPVVSGNTVVWSDKRTGSWKIYGYDLSTKTEFSIPTNNSPMTDYDDGQAIAIDGDNIVWMDNRIGGRGIYGYNLLTKQEFLISSGAKYFPQIDGHLVLWNNEGAPNTISGYNLLTQTQFDIGPGCVPAISGDTVVFHSTYVLPRSVWGYDLSTNSKILISDDNTNQCNPDVSGNIAVWRADRDGSDSIWDILGYDFLTNQRFIIAQDTGGSLYQPHYPIIDGNIVVWDGGGYNLTTNNPLSISIGEHPYVDGNIIVWEQNGDIYGTVIPEPCTLLLLGLGGMLIRKR